MKHSRIENSKRTNTRRGQGSEKGITVWERVGNWRRNGRVTESRHGVFSRENTSADEQNMEVWEDPGELEMTNTAKIGEV